MRKRIILLVTITLMLTGCGKEETEPEMALSSTTYLTYNVSTSDTVEILFDTKEDFNIKGSTEKSEIIVNDEVVADIEFATTAEVLSYTRGVVPKTVAGYPCFKLPTEKADVAAIVLGDNTSILLTARGNYDAALEAIEDCTIWCY